MTTAYVVGNLAELLRSYLDAEDIAAPSIRRSLATIPRHGRITMQRWWQLLEDIYREHPEPALGVRIGQHVQAYHSGPLGYLIMSCDTLGAALMRFARYQSLLHTFSAVQLTAQGADIVVSWDTDQGLSTQLSDEVHLAGLVGFIRTITGRPDLAPRLIQFNHPGNGPTALYEELLGCKVAFDGEQVAVVFPTELLQLKINSSDPHLLALLEKQAQATLGRQSDDAFMHQLRKTISAVLPEGEATLDFCSKQMFVSTRTLHRRLDERGTRFQDVLRDTRKELTRMYLEDASLSLPEIALLLGYAEQSVFSRACKQWFGLSPRELRRRMPTQFPQANTA